MVKIYFKIVLLISFILLFNSCDIINKEEQIPSYISVNEFILQTIPSLQGPANHKITDVWITVNGHFIGVFELPAKFPVLAEGDVSIFMKAGIKNNGIAASRENYPFYEPVLIDTVLMAGENLLLTPVTKYREETVFDWFENFEDPGISIDTVNMSMAGINDTISGGSNAALVRMTNSKYVFRAETISKYNFPQDNTSLYFEMDYKSNNPFIVGLMITTLGQISENPIIAINPVDEWNKIYIDLTYLSATYNFSDNYSLYLSATKTDSLSNGIMMFDNLKLVHF